MQFSVRRSRTAWRVGVAAGCVLLAAVGTALTARRVFGAAEVVTEVTRAYPTPAAAGPGVIGTLAAAPLIVDGRLRVYATTRQIRADAPVDARTQRSPYWSYRRWPQQVVGVVAARTTVVGRWSDGQLVAIDARTGTVAWRAGGPVPETTGYTGRRTGAATVYAPDGLHTAGDVVIARGGLEAVAYRVGDGRELWRRAVPGRECRAGEFTTAGGRYVVVGGCDTTTVEAYDAGTGRPVELWPRAGDLRGVEPVGCRVARSECGGARVTDRTGTRGWLLHGDRPAAAPGLAADAWLAGDIAVVRRADGSLGGVDARTGADAWTWRPAGRARVVAVQPGRVHVLTADFWLATLDAATGVERSRLHFTYGRERTGWSLGHAYAERSFLLVERLAPRAQPRADDDEYYFIAQPVLLAGT